MATNPGSKGIGTGTAQVFDTSGIAQQYGQNVMLEQQRKAAEAKAMEKKVAELSGAADGIFKEKIFANRDTGLIKQKYDDIQNFGKGKWHLIADPSTPESQQYKEMYQDLMFTAKKSQEAKELGRPFMDAIGLKPDEWEPEAKEYMNYFMNTPGEVFDVSKMKKINNFDPIADFDKKNNEFIGEIKNKPTQLGVFDVKGGEYYGQGEKVFASKEDRENFMTNVFANWNANPKAVGKLQEMFGKQAEDEGRTVMEVAWDAFYPKTEINASNISYSKNSGAGKEEPFNPNNIVENFSLKTGGDWNTLFGSVGSGIDFNVGELGIINEDTKMYQTVPMRTVLPISKNVINIQTGEKYKGTGTFNVTFGSPINYQGKIMFPAILKETNESVLIPGEELQEPVTKKGYDYSKIKNALENKSGSKKAKTVVQNGFTYTLNENTGEYE